MSKNSKDAYGAEGKSNVLSFDPDNLVLVTDEASPLYDERVHLPVSEPLVLNIMHHGVLEPVLVTKNPESGETEVVVGRQRVKAAREANKRLSAQGLQTVLVPGIVRRGSPAALAAVMVSENECREDDTAMGRAKKMERLMGFGYAEERLPTVFGCSASTVKNTLALLECSAAVRTAVEKGDITVTHAYKLSKLEPAEQKAKVAELVAAGAGSTGKAKARKQKAVVAKGPAMRSKREITAMLDKVHGEAHSALAWVLGSDDVAFARPLAA